MLSFSLVELLLLIFFFAIYGIYAWFFKQLTLLSNMYPRLFIGFEHVISLLRMVIDELGVVYASFIIMRASVLDGLMHKEFAEPFRNLVKFISSSEQFVIGNICCICLNIVGIHIKSQSTRRDYLHMRINKND